MEENTDPKANTAELISESHEASELDELGNKEANAEDSPEDENVSTDAQMAMDVDEETDVGEEEDKEGSKEHDLRQLEISDDVEEPTKSEQVNTEEKVTEESEAKDDVSEDTKKKVDETLNNESEKALTEVAPAEISAKSEKEKKQELEKKDSIIIYHAAPRFAGDFEEEHRTSGDFLVMGQGIPPPVKFYKYMEQGEEEEEEEEIEEQMEEQYTSIDRGPYYEKHINLTKLIESEKIENNILQKKLSIYFKRRRMEHVLKETDQKVDTLQKYNKKLDAYAELLEIDSRQRTTITEELQNLKETRESKYVELENLFGKLQEREKEIGTGLINSNTGNPIPDKVIERLIRLQKSEMETVSSMRLKFIKLKYLLSEKQEAISIIDKIGEDLYLMDFEQLKVENRGLADKIEERDEELTKLRSKCQNTIQILAHMREKTAALESDIDDLKDDLSMVESQSIQSREQLNSLKQERDYYRNMANKLRSDSGLLTEVELLRDMEDSMEELKTLTEDLENMKAENKTKAQQIRNIRRNIEFASEGIVKKSNKCLVQKKTSPPRFYKGRPSIFAPTLPKDAFKQ